MGILAGIRKMAEADPVELQLGPIIPTLRPPAIIPDEPEGEAGELSGADNMGEGRWA